MPAPLRIVLMEAEEGMLSELRVATTVPQRTRDRAHMLRLNAQGLNVPAIAKIFECHEHTVRATIRRWQSGGLSGLWEAPGRGAKRRWVDADIEYIENHLREKDQTYQQRAIIENFKRRALSAYQYCRFAHFGNAFGIINGRIRLVAIAKRY